MQKLQHSGCLPAMPAIAIKILEATRNPDLTPQQLATLIAQDPATSAQVLRVANSSLFPRRRDVSSIPIAVAVLGMNLCASVAITVALVGAMRQGNAPSFPSTRYWRRSLLSAIIAHRLGQQMGVHNVAELFIAGLLQDIGILALSNCVGGGYDEMYARVSNHQELLLAEHDIFGADHADIGVWLLNDWALPIQIVEAISNSHALEYGHSLVGMDNFRLVLAASGPMADMWCSDVVPDVAIAAILEAAIDRIGEELMDEVFEQVVQAAPAISSLFGIDLVR